MVQNNTNLQSCLCVFNKNLQHTRTGSKCLFCVALGEAEGSRLKARTQKSRAKNFKGFFHISFQFKGEHPIHIQYIGLYHLCFQFNSLLLVSRYIDTAFADKGSHQKKIYSQNVRTHLSSDY